LALDEPPDGEAPAVPINCLTPLELQPVKVIPALTILEAFVD
jgi:hypothetical protein